MYKYSYLKYFSSSLYNVLPRRIQHALIRTDFVGSVHYSPDESVSWNLPLVDHTLPLDNIPQPTDPIPDGSYNISTVYLYLVVAMMFLFILPLPHFFCGVFIGTAFTFFLGLLILSFAAEVIVDNIEEAYFNEKLEKRNSIQTQPSIANSSMTQCPPLQEWMTLQTNENTSRTAVFTEFCDELMVISYPRLNIDPRNVKTDIRTAEFIQRRKISITDASIYLLPSNLNERKFWSKKHPVCVDTSPGPIFYLFFSSQRSKEVWYRRLSSATSAGSSIFPSIQSINSILLEKTVQGGLPYYESDHVPDEREAAQRIADFMAFMGSTPSLMDTAADWLNMFTRRMFYHICTSNFWRENFCRKIEHKFKNMDLPSIIDGIDVKSVEIGTNFPEIMKLHKPQFDGMGLWLDFDLFYGGGFRIQLQTRVNLFKLMEEGSSNYDDAEYPTDKRSSRILKKVRSSSYFKRALEIRLVKNSMENIANTPLILDVEVTGLEGTMTMNLPNPPTDRLWFGFKTSPKLYLAVKPKVGEISINDVLCKVVKKLLLTEFEREAVYPNMVDVITQLFVSPKVQVGPKI